MQTNAVNLLQVNHQQYHHEIDVSEHTISNMKKIHTNKYIKHDPSESLTTSMREKRINKYENAHVQAVAIEFPRRQEREPSASRRFVRLFVWTIKGQDKASNSQLCVKLRVNKRVMV